PVEMLVIDSADASGSASTGSRVCKRAAFAHDHAVAAPVEAHPGHEFSYEEQATAAAAFQVFRGARIGDGPRIEAVAFVFDFRQNAMGADVPRRPDALGGIASVAVLDGIDEG